MSDGPHILVVDDDSRLRELLRKFLSERGFRVTTAAHSGDAEAKLRSLAFDLLVLDVMMPGETGIDFTKRLRQSNSVPILLLTARAESHDRIAGLAGGADDYLAKPFNPHELVARVRALLRRSRMSGAEADRKLISHSGLVIFVAGRRVEVSGQEVSLTPLEFSLLHALAASPGHVLSRQDLLDRAWGQDFFGVERTVDVHIRNLRQKLARAAPDRQYISSVRGVGYRFEA